MTATYTYTNPATPGLQIVIDDLGADEQDRTRWRRRIIANNDTLFDDVFPRSPRFLPMPDGTVPPPRTPVEGARYEAHNLLLILDNRLRSGSVAPDAPRWRAALGDLADGFLGPGNGMPGESFTTWNNYLHDLKSQPSTPAS